MSKRSIDWQPEIDQGYEKRVAALESMSPGHVENYVGQPTTERTAIVPAQPPSWVPEVRPERPTVTAYPVNPVQTIDINPARNIDQQVIYQVTPGSRADALIKRLVAWSIPLAILTGMVMYVFTLYPVNLATMAIFALWMAIALTETLIVFLVLSILDYRETPAAQNRTAMNKVLRMMAIEQGVRLITTSGVETYERAVQTIRRAGL